MAYDPNQPHAHGQPAQPVQPVQPVQPAQPVQPVAATPHSHEPAYTAPAASDGWTGYAAIKYVAMVVIVLAVVIGFVYLLPRIF